MLDAYALMSRLVILGLALHQAVSLEGSSAIAQDTRGTETESSGPGDLEGSAQVSNNKGRWHRLGCTGTWGAVVAPSR
jgi:hypothetical protein